MSECCDINLAKHHAGVCICINRPKCCGLNHCTAILNKFISDPEQLLLISDHPSNATKPQVNASLLQQRRYRS